MSIIDTVEESPIPRIRKKREGSLSVIPLRVWVSSLAPNSPCSFAISIVPKFALLRGLRDVKRLPQNPVSFQTLPLPLSLSNRLTLNHPSVISCSSAAPVGLNTFDLLPNGRRWLGAHCKFSDALSSPNREKRKHNPTASLLNGRDSLEKRAKISDHPVTKFFPSN
ncbi:hypothetical protein TNCV_1433451 [Trichonephila clavipes]|nr:hypothetical protein TNCV_1433451 [Trichonephila clavipes]